LTPNKLNAMIDSYYRSRGLEPNGVPTPGTVRELDLDGLTGHTMQIAAEVG
jgi:aldehyde:ferredoxin oxidoreductase